MLQYLIILLDDTSVSFCHRDNTLAVPKLMPLDTLRKAIVFGMKENLSIHFVFPEYRLPSEYYKAVESTDHVKVFGCGYVCQMQGEGFDESCVIVANAVDNRLKNSYVVLRISLEDAIRQKQNIAELISCNIRVNVCFTDVERFSDSMIPEYEAFLDYLSAEIQQIYRLNKRPLVNILTDRIELKQMHNCGAGHDHITVAPNGMFYICPSFYYDERMGIDNLMHYKHPSSDRYVGDLESGLGISNSALLDLQHAPLCRNCDAFHCNRCVWLNQKLTLDINTPSHQQCVMSHVERNAGRALLKSMRERGPFMTDIDIQEIDYLDPFFKKQS